MPDKYYGGPGQKHSRTSRSINTQLRLTKKQKREAAFAKPGTGQFSAGALREKAMSGRRDNQTVAPPVRTKFKSGRTGQTHFLTTNEPTTPDNYLQSQTSKFADKANFADAYNKLLAEQSTLPNSPQNVQVAQQGIDFNNPQNPGVFGVQPPQPALPTPPPFVPNAAVDNRGFDAAAPYGRSSVDGRPFTQEESGRASVITAEDLFAVMPGSFGAGISTSALKGLNLKLVKETVNVVGTIPKNGITTKIATTVKSAIAKELGTYWTWAKAHPLSMGAGVIGALATTAFAIFKLSVSGKQFGQFLGEEGAGASGFVANIAFQNDNPQLALSLLKLQEEGINKIANISNVPYKGTAEGFKLFADQALPANKAMQAIVQDQIDNPEEDYETKRNRIFDREMAAKQAMSDQQNLTRITIFDYEQAAKKELFDYEQAARAGASSSERAARRQQLEEEAAFWAEQKILMFKLDAEERERQAAFWLEYKKMVLLLEQKAREDQGSSTLHFGLLR